MSFSAWPMTFRGRAGNPSSAGARGARTKGGRRQADGQRPADHAARPRRARRHGRRQAQARLVPPEPVFRRPAGLLHPSRHAPAGCGLPHFADQGPGEAGNPRNRPEMGDFRRLKPDLGPISLTVWPRAAITCRCAGPRGPRALLQPLSLNAGRNRKPETRLKEAGPDLSEHRGRTRGQEGCSQSSKPAASSTALPPRT